MELIKKIRLRIGDSILRKKVDKTRRKVRYSGIDSVKKIGIVWDATNPADFPYLSGFFQKMNERKVDVQIMGYYPGKNLPDQYTAIRYLNFIRREEVNFFFIPVASEPEAFIKKRFDILIDINFKKLLPLRYLSSLSDAALKVGLFEPEKNGDIFDLMIEMKEPINIENYLNQTILYLEMIHAEQVEKTY
jgi:hypothetical protein